MRIHGYQSAQRSTATGAGARPAGHGSGPEAAPQSQMRGPDLALRLAPVVDAPPAGPDMRFMAQLVGQMTRDAQHGVEALAAYDRSPDDDAERPYWAGRPVKFLI